MDAFSGGGGYEMEVDAHAYLIHMLIKHVRRNESLIHP